MNSPIEKAKEAMRARRFSEAEQFALQAASLDSQSQLAWSIIAESRSLQNNIAGAMEAAERLFQFDAENPKTLWFLLSLRWRSGNYPMAVSYAEQLAKLTPQDPAVFNSLGLCRLGMEDWPGAIHAFKQGLNIDPKSAALHYGLASALDKAGNWSRAYEEHKRALSLDPKHAGSLFGLADLDVRQAKGENGLDMLGRLLQGPKSDRPNGQASYLSEAAELLEKLLAIDPNHARAHSLKASVLTYQGDHDKARQELETATELDPNLANAYWNATRSRKIHPSDRPLVEQMRNLLSNPNCRTRDRVLLENALGKALDDLGEYREALTHFDEAHRIGKSIAKISFDRQEYEPKTIQTEGIDTEVPIFVVGMPRSGTTLVEQILSAHPDVRAAGELPFWPDIAPRVAAKPKLAHRVGQIYLKELNRLGAGSQRVIDKNPFNFMHVGLLHAVFPKARFLWCLRNPIDNCISIYMEHFAFPPPWVHDRSDLVFVYRQHLRLLDYWQKVIPRDLLTVVQYESLVENQEQEARRLVQFCGLDWNEAVLQPEKNERMVLTASHWQVRQPVYKTSVDRWRRYEGHLGAFAELAHINSVSDPR